MITQMTSSGWREVLVDVDHTPPEGKTLRYVLAPSVTPASAVYTPGHKGAEGAWLEVCPQGLVMAQEIAERVVGGGGAALIADYGNTGSKNSLRVSPGRGVGCSEGCDLLLRPLVSCRVSVSTSSVVSWRTQGELT